jgi:predicted RNase H-like HicB family nuclease
LKREIASVGGQASQPEVGDQADERSRLDADGGRQAQRQDGEGRTTAGYSAAASWTGLQSWIDGRDLAAGGDQAMTQVEYIARVHEEEGSLWAEVLDLPGCFASGNSLDELREALEESIALYLSGDATDLSDVGVAAAPKSLSVDEMRISVLA